MQSEFPVYLIQFLFFPQTDLMHVCQQLYQPEQLLLFIRPVNSVHFVCNTETFLSVAEAKLNVRLTIGYVRVLCCVFI